jgi:hypothetical protein
MHNFAFDLVFDQSSSQETVYQKTAKSLIMNCLEVPFTKRLLKGLQRDHYSLRLDWFWKDSHDRGFWRRNWELRAHTPFYVAYIWVYKKADFQWGSDILFINRVNLW